MKNIINNIKNKLPIIVIIFLYIQPFLDVTNALLNKINILNNITSIIRFLFVAFMLIYLIIEKYKNKKTILIYITILLLTIITHLGIMYYINPSTIFINLRYTLSTYYFIFILLSFYVLYQNNNFNKKHLQIIFIIYLLFILVPNIFNIGFKTYWHSKLGSTGWFKSANVTGSIILILFVTTINEFKKSKLIYKIITIMLILFTFFNLGTKTPALGLIILLIINIIFMIYKIIKNKNKKGLIITLALILLTTLCSVVLIPKTTFYKNIMIHYNYLQENNKTSSYELIDNMIFSERLTFVKNTNKIYKNSSILEKLFGIGYIENNIQKIIEIDYFDIFYREGIIGFILYFIPIILITIKYLKNIKPNFEKINDLYALILIFILALFQGHMFITPAISIFIALILVINSKEVNYEFNN